MFWMPSVILKQKYNGESHASRQIRPTTRNISPTGHLENGVSSKAYQLAPKQYDNEGYVSNRELDIFDLT